MYCQGDPLAITLYFKLIDGPLSSFFKAFIASSNSQSTYNSYSPGTSQMPRIFYIPTSPFHCYDSSGHQFTNGENLYIAPILSRALRILFA